MLVDYAFSDLALDLVWAGTVTANAASRRTLAAIGMVQTEQQCLDVLTYQLTRHQWLASRA